MNYKDKIALLKFEETKENKIENKIPVDLRTIAKRALENKKMEVNEKNIEITINLYK